MTPFDVAQRMEQTICEYIRMCNAADAAGISAQFTPEATHYFPHAGKWTGASVIGECFAKVVAERGISWSVDCIVTDAARCEAVMEWTQFTRSRRQMVRGIDWFNFHESTLLIRQVRCYFAANWPVEPRRELQDFDYASRGYPVTFPGP